MPQGSALTPRTATYILGFANLLAFINCIWTVKKFGRRPLLFWGHAGIAISHAVIAVSIMTGFNFGVIVAMCFFIWIYANTTGTIAWVYSAETCTDIGMGVCLLTLWGVVFIEVLLVPTLINTALHV